MTSITARIWSVLTDGDRMRALSLSLDVTIVGLLQLANVHCLFRMVHTTGAGVARAFALLLVSLLATRWSFERLERRCVRAFGDFAHRRSLDLIGRFARMSLLDFERLGATRISTALTVDLERLRQVGINMSGVLTGVVTSLMCLLYVSLLGALAGATVAGWMVLVGASTFAVARLSRAGRLRIRAQRQRLAERLADLVRGFPQVRLHRERSDDLQAGIDGEEARLRAAMFEVGTLRARSVSERESGRLLVLLVIGFVVPLVVEDGQREAASMLFLALFALRYVMLMATQVALLADADELFARVDGFEALLVAGPADDGAPAPTVERLALRDLCFTYPPDGRPVPFSLGPIDLTLRAGELVFLVGANGSGKSSLVKTLTGLYPASAGAIAVDGRPVPRAVPQSYRELFSVIFADPAVHARLYGLDDAAVARAPEVLRLMGLDGAVRCEGGRWSTVELSTGQRKRLCMAIALLEDRPICVFDEWAADQDPAYKARYYDELLPMLRDRGKIVLVVSHDDRWFDRADRVVVLRDGRLV